MRILRSTRLAAVFLLVAGPVVVLPTLRGPGKVEAAPADKGDKPGKDDLHDVNLEVIALQVLSQLQVTPAQLTDLAKRAPSTAAEAPARPVVKVSDKYRKTLTDLLSALRANNEERADELTTALETLREKETPALDEEVEITEEARKQAPQVLRRLSPRQVAGYILDYAGEFPDPREKIGTAFEDVRTLTGTEWQDARDEVAEQVGWLVAGVEAEAEKKVRDKVADLLTRVHRLSEADFKAQREKLDKEADAIVENVGPTDVLRHFMERSLAELLSNPRLADAVKARQKASK